MRSAAIAVIAAVLGLVLRKNSPEAALMLAVAAAVCVLFFASTALGAVTEFISSLAETAGVQPAVLSVVLKTVGIAIVTRLAADICRDASHSSSASAIELAGAGAALYIAIPLMETVFRTVEGLV